MFSVTPTFNLQEEVNKTDIFTRILKSSWRNMAIKVKNIIAYQKIPQMLSHNFYQSKILCKIMN